MLSLHFVTVELFEITDNNQTIAICIRLLQNSVKNYIAVVFVNFGKRSRDIRKTMTLGIQHAILRCWIH